MKLLHCPLATLLIVCLSTVARAYDTTPVIDPEALGFSSSRLARIAAWQQTQIDAGAFAGAVSAIARNGRVAYLRAVGFRDRTKIIPLQPDAIFWIASMTKPVTSVAAMMLVDEGRLDLSAPVHQYLPEFRDMTVGVETKDPTTGKTELAREPQKHPMTVEDLLRHTSGLVYPDLGNTAVHKFYWESEPFFARYARDSTLKEFASGIARLPLAHQPGEVWEYGLSIDVLGRVIEVASGQPLDQFLDSRLFKPLGMVDTGFWVPPEKLARLIAPPGDAKIQPDRDVTKPTTLFSGGGGLVSTAADYLRFCQMLLNGGELDGVRILSSATVRRMTTNSLPPDIRFALNSVGPRAGSTWGLGFAIRGDPDWSAVPGSVGSFTWGGVWGTNFWVDPAAQLIAVNLIQVAPGKGGPFNDTFRNLTYGAFRVPDQGVPDSAAAPVRIDADALTAYQGTYAFGFSTSARDRRVPEHDVFIGLGMQVSRGGAREPVKITSTFEHGPAAKAGVKAGDTITQIDGKPIEGRSVDQIVEQLRGAAGSSVQLSLLRDGEALEMTIVRAPIRPQAADLEVAVTDGKLLITATGTLPVLDFEKGAPITVVPISSNEFFVDGGDHTRIAFLYEGAGEQPSLVLNPGPWQITGQRIN
jgi:CubicO group peptidase (beta-lactamase class C family)